MSVDAAGSFEPIQLSSHLLAINKINKSVGWDDRPITGSGFLHWEQENLVGYVNFRVEGTGAHRKIYIPYIAVDQNQPKRGIGKALMGRVMEYAKQQNIDSVELECRMEKVGTFYRRVADIFHVPYQEELVGQYINNDKKSRFTYKPLLPKENEDTKIVDIPKFIEIHNIYPHNIQDVMKNQRIDHTSLIEIAKFFATLCGFNTALYIKNFGLDPTNPEDKKALIEIAKLCAKQCGWGTAQNIKNFGLDPTNPEDKEALIEILKLCAQQSGVIIRGYTENFGLDPVKDKDVLIEIIKLYAQQNGNNTALCIEELGLDFVKDKQALIEIAKLCAQQNGLGTAQFIKNFGLDPTTPEDKQALIEIAKLCAKQCGFGTAQNIKNFGLDPKNLKDKQALIEIAKLCAQQDGWGTARYIKRFGLDPTNPEDKQALIEILKLCAQQAGMRIRDYTENFELDPVKDKDVLIEIIKIYAQQNGNETALRIKKLGLDFVKDKQALIEIAKLCAQQDGRGTAVQIKEFGLDPTNPEDKQALIAIAKLCVQTSGAVIAAYIKNFGLDPTNPEDKQALIEIAKLCARQDGRKTAEHLSNFGLDGTTAQELFDLCVEQNLFTLLDMNLQDYAFGALFNVLRAVDASNWEEERLRSWCRANYLFADDVDQVLKEIREPHIRGQLIHPLAGRAILDYVFGALFNVLRAVDASDREEDQLRRWCQENSLFADDVDQVLKEIREPHVRGQLIHQLAGAILLLHRKFPREKLTEISNEGILSKIFRLRAPHLRVPLVGVLSRALISQTSVSQTSVSQTSVSQTSVSQTLSRLVPIRLTLSGKYPEVIAMEVSMIALEKQGLNLLPFIEAMNGLLHRTFKHAPRYKEAIYFLMLLEKAPCSQEEKQRCLNQLLCSSKESFVLHLQILIMILEFEETTLFQPKMDIPKTGTTALERHLPDLGVEDISSKWTKTFGSCRDPMAIKTYLARISASGDRRAIDGVARFIKLVLEGTFLERRYTLEENSHLQTMGQECVDLWKQGETREVIPKPTAEKSWDPQKWLHQKLIVDHHVSEYPEKYPALAAILQGAEVPTVSQNTEGWEQLAIELLKVTDKAKQLELLEEMYRKASGEFANDILAAIQALSSSQTRSHVVVVDTDDPYDLLLCGTEVLGSCQRVGGDPLFNKGLLGYLLNGQTRLLAVKDSNGRILSRMIFRLLYDKEKKCPVLFLERVYGDESYGPLLIQLASEKATKMDLVLTTLNNQESSSPYNGSLTSLGGVAPYEYCDGDDGVKDNGEFSIQHASIIVEQATPLNF